MERGIITISKNGVVSVPSAPIWMTQFEIADLFGVFSCEARKAIHCIYKNKELNEVDTMKYVKQPDGISYDTYRVRSKESALFRRFAITEICATKRATPITLLVSCSRGSNLWYS